MSEKAAKFKAFINREGLKEDFFIAEKENHVMFRGGYRIASGEPFNTFIFIDDSVFIFVVVPIFSGGNGWDKNYHLLSLINELNNKYKNKRYAFSSEALEMQTSYIALEEDFDPLVLFQLVISLLKDLERDYYVLRSAIYQ